jgi:arylsulfatase
LTGEYPDVAVDSGYNLATETVASTLSEEGYATAGFHSNPFVSRAYGFDRGFDHFDDDLHLGQHKLIALAQRAVDKLRNRHYARAEEINERSLAWVDSLEEEQPFFLWNHYMDTHGPYEPPGKYATVYSDTGMSGRDAQSLYQRAIDDPESITESERQLLVDLYDGEIRYNDAKIGEFLDALRERGLLAESLLIVTADHGDAFGEHGYYEHPRYLHDALTRVPLLVRTPDEDSKSVEPPVSTLDIVATLEKSIGGDSNDGTSLFDFQVDRQVYSQARGESDNSRLRRYAIRDIDGSCFCERNLETNELSFQNCSDRSLRNKLEKYVKRRINVESGGMKSTSKEVNENINRRLSALGYKE